MGEACPSTWILPDQLVRQEITELVNVCYAAFSGVALDNARNKFPERDEKLSRQRYDRCFTQTATIAFDALLKPEGER